MCKLPEEYATTARHIHHDTRNKKASYRGREGMQKTYEWMHHRRTDVLNELKAVLFDQETRRRSKPASPIGHLAVNLAVTADPYCQCFGRPRRVRVGKAQEEISPDAAYRFLPKQEAWRFSRRKIWERLFFVSSVCLDGCCLLNEDCYGSSFRPQNPKESHFTARHLHIASQTAS